MKIPSLLGALLLTACAQKFMNQTYPFPLRSQHQIKTALKLERPVELKYQVGTQLQHVTGASGLVIIKNKLYVISDDTNHLNQFDFPLQAAALPVSLFAGDLSNVLKERKKQKPDLEAITLLDYPQGQQSLLLVPSGSKENRIKGAMLTLDKKGVVDSTTLLDFGKLYEHLNQKITKLNIEGIAVGPNQIFMLSRANSKKAKDTLISLDRHCIFSTAGVHFDPKCLQDMKYFEIGHWGPAPLTFTDMILLDDQHLLFLATAENTDDAYDDGAVLGSVLGKLNFKTGIISWLRPLSEPIKAEGLALRRQANKIEIYISSDPDDMEQASLIHQASLDLDEL